MDVDGLQDGKRFTSPVSVATPAPRNERRIQLHLFVVCISTAMHIEE